MAETKSTKLKKEIAQRSAINRARRQEDLREKVQAGQALEEIARCTKELSDLDQEVKHVKLERKENEDGSVELVLPGVVISKADCRTRILARIIDTKFKLLNKVLPDLKQIELTDPQGNSFETFANAVSALNRANEE